MIVRFPDNNYPNISVEFDTETYTANYRRGDGSLPYPCCLERIEWVIRLQEWQIDLSRLMIEQGIDPDLAVDTGL